MEPNSFSKEMLQHRLVLVLALPALVVWMLASGSAVHASGGFRHVIVGYDISSSMKKSVGYKPELIKQLNNHLLDILFRHIPTSVQEPFELSTTPNEVEHLNLSRPLCVEGDLITYFTFDEKAHFVYRRRKGLVKLEDMATVLPKYENGFQGLRSFISAARVAAYDHYEPDSERETYVVLISDFVIDESGIPEEYANFIRRALFLYERQLSLRSCYSLNAGRKIYINVYKVFSEVPPKQEAPSSLPGRTYQIEDPSRPGHPVRELTFSADNVQGEVALQVPYNIVPNPQIPQQRMITGVSCIVKSVRDYSEAHKSVIFSGNPTRSVSLKPLVLDGSLAGPEYVMDIEVTYKLSAAKSSPASAKITGIRLGKEEKQEELKQDCPTGVFGILQGKELGILRLTKDGDNLAIKDLKIWAKDAEALKTKVNKIDKVELRVKDIAKTWHPTQLPPPSVLLDAQVFTKEETASLNMEQCEGTVTLYFTCKEGGTSQESHQLIVKVPPVPCPQNAFMVVMAPDLGTQATKVRLVREGSLLRLKNLNLARNPASQDGNTVRGVDSVTFRVRGISKTWAAVNVPGTVVPLTETAFSREESTLDPGQYQGLVTISYVCPGGTAMQVVQTLSVMVPESPRSWWPFIVAIFLAVAALAGLTFVLRRPILFYLVITGPQETLQTPVYKLHKGKTLYLSRDGQPNFPKLDCPGCLMENSDNELYIVRGSKREPAYHGDRYELETREGDKVTVEIRDPKEG